MKTLATIIAISMLALLTGCETTALGYRKTAGGAYTTQTLKNVNIYGNVTFGEQKETGRNEMAGTASGFTADAKVDRTAVGGNDAAVSAETAPASEQPQAVSEKEILSSEKTEKPVAKKPVAKPAK